MLFRIHSQHPPSNLHQNTFPIRPLPIPRSSSRNIKRPNSTPTPSPFLPRSQTLRPPNRPIRLTLLLLLLPTRPILLPTTPLLSFSIQLIPTHRIPQPSHRETNPPLSRRRTRPTPPLPQRIPPTARIPPTSPKPSSSIIRTRRNIPRPPRIDVTRRNRRTASAPQTAVHRRRSIGKRKHTPMVALSTRHRRSPTGYIIRRKILARLLLQQLPFQRRQVNGVRAHREPRAGRRVRDVDGFVREMRFGDVDGAGFGEFEGRDGRVRDWKCLRGVRGRDCDD